MRLAVNWITVQEGIQLEMGDRPTVTHSDRRQCGLGRFFPLNVKEREEPLPSRWYRKAVAQPVRGKFFRLNLHGYVFYY